MFRILSLPLEKKIRGFAPRSHEGKGLRPNLKTYSPWFYPFLAQNKTFQICPCPLTPTLRQRVMVTYATLSNNKKLSKEMVTLLVSGKA